MGFGTLFIGYFLLLNIGYYSMTDVISAAVMLLGLYNLSRINKPFRLGMWLCAIFALFGAAEFFFGVSDMFFGLSTSPALLTAFSAVRFALIALLTAFIFLGIREVSIEVELPEMPVKCLTRIIMSSAVFGLGFLLEVGALHFLGVKAHNILSAVTLICELIIVVMNLTVIYGAYMRICMPEDNLPSGEKEVKKSRFAFVNQYRERKAERQREEAEYRLKKIKELSKSNKGGRKKK